MPAAIFIVDAFTKRAFSGNPAAVVWMQQRQADAWMQHVAAEMNLSETAFICPHSEDGFHLRWFTPTAEIDLCGHATLAAAHILWSEEKQPKDANILFHTNSGPLTCSLSDDGTIWMDFPSRTAQPMEAPNDLLVALGVMPTFVGRNVDDILVVVDSPQAVVKMRPDIDALMDISCRGVIVTAASEDKHIDFVSRFFAPAIGISEDPVTGSAHCCLAPYWSNTLKKQTLVGFQASKRGGIVHMETKEDRVRLAGQAVTVLRGKLSDEALNI